jgi:hypothetical protein
MISFEAAETDAFKFDGGEALAAARLPAKQAVIGALQPRYDAAEAELQAATN